MPCESKAAGARTWISQAALDLADCQDKIDQFEGDPKMAHVRREHSIGTTPMHPMHQPPQRAHTVGLHAPAAGPARAANSKPASSDRDRERFKLEIVPEADEFVPWPATAPAAVEPFGHEETKTK